MTDIVDRKIPITRDHIYYSYSERDQKFILVAAGLVALITPFTDTIYLPALDNVSDTLDASDALVAITVSTYLAAVGVGQLVWGPLSDYYGRVPILYITLILFEAFTIGCIFADSINTLIVLRTLEGFIVGATVVSVQAVIADVFAPKERGSAMGAFLAPLLLGPIIAPLVGGVIADTFSWRGDFVLLAIMTVPIGIFSFFASPETHHWHVMQTRGDYVISSSFKRIQAKSEKLGKAASLENLQNLYPKKDGDGRVDEPTQASQKSSNGGGTSTKEIQDLNALLVPGGHSDVDPPRLMSPLEVAAGLLDLQLAPHFAMAGLAFACMFTTLTILPLYLAKAPYNLSAGIIGVTFLPVGFGMLFGAITGGAGSDIGAKKYFYVIEGILVNSYSLAWLCPVATLLFGFALHKTWSLGAVLIIQTFVGFGQSLCMPAQLAYLSTARPASAAAMGAAMLFLCFVFSAVSVTVSVPASENIGVHYFFLIIACLCGGAYIVCSSIVFYKVFVRKYDPSEGADDTPV